MVFYYYPNKSINGNDEDEPEEEDPEEDEDGGNGEEEANEYITLDETEELWSNLTDRTWRELSEELKSEREQPTIGIEDAVIDRLREIATEMDEKEIDFPATSRGLYKKLNEEF